MAKHLCRTWRPISISKADKLTKDTTREIVEANAAQEVWCSAPKGKPAAKEIADELRSNGLPARKPAAEVDAETARRTG